MNEAWILVAIVGIATLALKGTGAAFLGGKPLPDRIARVISLLAPGLLAGLVVVQTLSDGKDLALDARVAGVAVAGVAVFFRTPVLVTLVLAAATTATVRALGVP